MSDVKNIFLVGLKDAPFYSRFDSLADAEAAASLVRRSNEPEIISVIESKSLIEYLEEKIEMEKFNGHEARELSGINSCGACMATGAIDAYREIFKLVKGEQ